MRHCYFDHNATTPVDAQVLETMMPYLKDVYGNASSLHMFGQEAQLGVEQARDQLAGLLDCNARDIVFTSGGTEAANLAIFGTVRAIKDRPRHVITSQIEHPAVLNACQQLEQEGVKVTYLPVNSEGCVLAGDVRDALRTVTVLITIMHANNELGTVQPIHEIGNIAKEAGVLFHTDGVQSCSKIKLSMRDLGVDYFSLSAHKIYGPKGVGALYIKRGVQIDKVQYGGSHERDRRPGTLNVPGIVGLGAAAELSRKMLEKETGHITELRDKLEQAILDRIPATRVLGAKATRVPNTTSIQFDHVEAEPLLIALDLKGFAVASGSACSSGAVEPSHVLMAIGLSRLEAKSTLRFSLGRQSKQEEVDALLEELPKIVKRLRSLSPTCAEVAWEVLQ